MKYNLFIGRWSPIHNGHKYIIDSFVGNGKPVCIAVRDSVERYPTELRKRMIETVFEEETKKGLVKVIIIPDIDTVAVSRTVGYSIIEVPEQVKTISATKVRAGECNEIHPAVKKLMEEYENANKKA